MVSTTQQQTFRKMSTLMKFLCYIIPSVIFLGLPNHINCYNLSPKPNVIFKEPDLATFMPKVESSFFGYTIVLRPLGIIIGAPRAQSSLERQRHINETGAIYRCPLKQNATCSPYIIDNSGNILVERSEYTYDSEKRDHQWLGGAMDGGVNDTDKLLVCAPRFIAPIPNDYLLHGICYWVNDTLTAEPQNIKRISPLRLKQDQLHKYEDTRYYYYMMSEMGLSAHVSSNNEEFLIGAPGIYVWRGSVIRYSKKYLTEDPNLSRRDTSGLPTTKQVDREFTYESDIPKPSNNEQSIDSYFGYSVGSGYFDSNDPTKLLYVATAPQANSQSGEAYIFDVTHDKIIRKYIFRGMLFGEYFGYSVLAEDLNGDGLTDVVISAPQHSISGSYDDGAIYVFTNLGRFNFERRILTSPQHGKVRFGTTLSKLGDINHDGFNDIAVGAPFANNGSVFIFLGSEKGLREQASQLLKSPIDTKANDGGHMFGHGLSKGSDIDGNGFNDFAIGAPNAEKVFLYRAYPVVQIHATIHSQTREIKPDQNRFQVNVCYSIKTTSKQISTQDLALHVVVDPQVNRVKITDTRSNELEFNVTAGTRQVCRTLDCDVRFSTADIFKPIDLEVHYDLINRVPNSEDFCNTCAAVDPQEPKIYTEKIIFSTGCASDICIADLQVKSTGLNHAYVLGSSRTLNVNYYVTNNGETAYLPQINITSSNRMPFARIPSTCKVITDIILVCDLNRGQPMAKGSSDSINIAFDVSNIGGSSMILTATVFSTGQEATPDNNVIKDVITLNEFTQIDAVGAPKTPQINLEKVSNSANIMNAYEIKSNGPSVVGSLDIVFNIPVAYKIAGSKATIPIINMNNITMQAVYDAQLVAIDYYENNTQILMNTIEISTSTISKLGKTVFEKTINQHYDPVKMGHINEIIPNEKDLSDSVMVSSISHRRRRDVAAQTATKDQYARISRMKAYELLDEDLKGTLPVNRTIVFNCNDPTMTVCLRAKMRIYNYKPDQPLTVTMKYTVDLNEVNNLLIEPWEFFVIFIGLDLKKVGDITGKSISVHRKIEYNIISKHQLHSTPWWVWLLAVIGGILVLALITYGLYKSGFFKRATMEERSALVHQNPPAEPEAENLNSGDNN